MTHRPASLFPAALLIGALAWPASVPAQAPVRPQGRVDCNFYKANRPVPAAAVIAPAVRGAFTPIPLESVQLIDKKLRRKVIAQGVEARRTETDTVEVLARILNCTNEPMQLQLRTTFLSAGQSPTEPVSSWQRLYLQPRSTGVYSEKSISPAVAHYLIEVRTGD
ncbi:hypothetical protein [Phenylobacterium sp.]|uniref:hypothetical protein n=1 Tax=Phenylobacterium sp. TaxID=1871053 RepID=UPI002ED7C7FF